MIWFAQQTRATLWGDGFVSDEWSDMVSLKDWDHCSPDEMIRVFPRLARAGTAPSKSVVDRVTECIAVLMWRLSSAGAQTPIPKSVSPETIEKMGPLWAEQWFRIRSGGWRETGGRRRESTAVTLIDDIAQDIADGRLRAFDAATAAEFVYWTGVHPVYLWPEALLSHALFTAIGWIGHAERYQQALMTQDIAEYFCSVITVSGAKSFRLLDGRLNPYVRSRRMASVILKSATRRLEGRRPVVRLTRKVQTGRPVPAWIGAH